MQSLKILVLEDDRAKLQDISSLLTTVETAVPIEPDYVYTSDSAKKKLRSELFDVLILDIVVPERPEAPLRGDEGIRLLDEMMARNIYKQPPHIISLTAFPERLDEAKEKFQSALISSILYDPSSDAWSQQLSLGLQRMASSKLSTLSSSRSYDALLCIVCALHDPELQAVLECGWQWKQINLPHDATTYYRAEVNIGDENRVVYAGAAARMGMPASAVLATKMIHHFSPKYISMAGIAAGVKEKTNFGDVLAANPCWDLGSGKWSVNDSKVAVFKPAPHAIILDADLRDKLARLSRDHDLLYRIRKNWKGAPLHDLRVLIGPVASGGSVLADGVTIERVRGEQHKDLLGIEMEAYSVFTAATESTSPRPKAFSLKSVVDFAMPQKDDKFHPYAAYTSAACTKAFVEEYLIPD